MNKIEVRERVATRCNSMAELSDMVCGSVINAIKEASANGRVMAAAVVIYEQDGDGESMRATALAYGDSLALADGWLNVAEQVKRLHEGDRRLTDNDEAAGNA